LPEQGTQGHKKNDLVGFSEKDPEQNSFLGSHITATAGLLQILNFYT